ncbi:hypothetical protein ACFV42_23520 [Streptomyces solisilvae]|uniref:hypothetical protein n=1 Tax=Streptomyces malaysiensis TaxID=92644 RepID=UPI0036B786AA
MRSKYLILSLLTTATLAITGCSGDPGISDRLRTGSLDSRQKAVVTTWYDVASRAEKKRLEALTDREVLNEVNAFTLLCVLDKNGIAAELAKEPGELSSKGAVRLAYAIDKHLCERGKKRTQSPSASSPSSSSSTTPKAAASRSVDANPSHDLTEPTSRHDREEMTRRAPDVPMRKPAPLVKRPLAKGR